MVSLLPGVSEDLNSGTLKEVLNGQNALLSYKRGLREEGVGYRAFPIRFEQDQIPILHSANPSHHQPLGGDEDSVVPWEMVRNLHGKKAQLRHPAEPSFQI